MYYIPVTAPRPKNVHGDQLKNNYWTVDFKKKTIADRVSSYHKATVGSKDKRHGDERYAHDTFSNVLASFCICTPSPLAGKGNRPGGTPDQ